MNLLLLDSKELDSSPLVRVSGERAKHLIQVKKVAPGYTVPVGALNAGVGQAVVERVEVDEVLLRIESLLPEEYEHDIHLILALPRPMILKQVLKIVAMMGVRRLMLIRARHVERSYFQSRLLDPEKMSYHLRLGMEQAMSAQMPEVVIHRRFKGFLAEELKEKAVSGEIRLLADPQATAHLAQLGLEQELTADQRVVLAVGPEAGWQNHEIEAFGDKGFRSFHIGERILRVESAVCALLAQIQLLQLLNTNAKGTTA